MPRASAGCTHGLVGPRAARLRGCGLAPRPPRQRHHQGAEHEHASNQLQPHVAPRQAAQLLQQQHAGGDGTPVPCVANRRQGSCARHVWVGSRAMQDLDNGKAGRQLPWCSRVCRLVVAATAPAWRVPCAWPHAGARAPGTARATASSTSQLRCMAPPMPSAARTCAALNSQSAASMLLHAAKNHESSAEAACSTTAAPIVPLRRGQWRRKRWLQRSQHAACATDCDAVWPRLMRHEGAPGPCAQPLRHSWSLQLLTRQHNRRQGAA